VQYADAIYPDSFGGAKDLGKITIPSFIIEKRLSTTHKIIVGVSSLAIAIVIALITLLIYKKTKHSGNVKRYRRGR